MRGDFGGQLANEADLKQLYLEVKMTL